METCRNEECGARFSDGGDGYDGLCPSCADRVEAYAEEHALTWEEAAQKLGL